MKDGIDDDLLWENENVEISVGTSETEIERVGCRVMIFDHESAILELTNSPVPFSLILDLRSKMVKEIASNKEGLNDHSYSYERLGCQAELVFAVTIQDDKKDTIIQALEFILSQYTLYSDNSELDSYASHDAQKPNVVAMGLEGVGVGFRSALRSGGRSTGSAIRYLGKKYTSATIGDGSDREKQVANQSQITEAKAHHARAETCHAGARTLTSAALAPVRWIGKSAAKLAPKNSTSEGKMSKVMHDTIGGMGNGVANICKGVTEALSEIGGAVGDATMHHSAIKNGEEYADKVTKIYVNAAGEIGLAGYKIGNIASFGVAGLILDAVAEGATYLVSLYEYLVGPVLLQGKMCMTMAPSTVPVMYFVVLRPWSVSFYKHASDFTGKPAKIIATCMLDSLPFLRQRGGEEAHSASPTQAQSEHQSRNIVCDIPSSEHGTDPPGTETGMGTGMGTETGVGTGSATRMGTDARLSSEVLSPSPMCGGEPKGAIHHKKSGYFNRMKGGSVSHIELCTVDCSTFLLYPEASQIDLWFSELFAAALRVETVEKRRSGACELAMMKRLQRLPKRRYVKVSLCQLVVSPTAGRSDDLDGMGSKGPGPILVGLPAPSALPQCDWSPEEKGSSPICSDQTDSPFLPGVGSGLDCTTVGDVSPTCSSTPPLPTAAAAVYSPLPVQERKGKENEGSMRDKPSWSEAVRNMALQTAFIRIQPVTQEGIVVTPEVYLSGQSRLKRTTTGTTAAVPGDLTLVAPSSSFLERGCLASLSSSYASTVPALSTGSLTAEWVAEVSPLSTLHTTRPDPADPPVARADASASTLPNSFEIGRAASVDSGDCERLCVTVRVTVVGGSTMELGRGYLPLADISHHVKGGNDEAHGVCGGGHKGGPQGDCVGSEERVVSIYRKNSTHLVAVLHLRAAWHDTESSS